MGVGIESFREQKEQALDWFFNRIIWMNNSLQIPAAEVTTVNISDYKHVKNGIIFHIDENYSIDGTLCIEGWAFVANMEDNSEYGSIGILKDQKVYQANECSCADVQETFSLSSDQVGFYIYTGFDGGTLCIIDEENEIIYEME